MTIKKSLPIVAVVMAIMMFVFGLSTNAIYDYYGGDTFNMGGTIELPAGQQLNGTSVVGSFANSCSANRNSHTMSYSVGTNIFSGYYSKASIKIYKLMNYEVVVNGITYTATQSSIVSATSNLNNVPVVVNKFYDPDGDQIEQWNSSNIILSGQTGIDTNWVYYFEIYNNVKASGNIVNHVIKGYYIIHGNDYSAVSYHVISGI